MKISEITRDYITEIKDRKIVLADGFEHDHYDILKRTEYYLNDRFVEGDNENIFWNIITPRITHFSKNIDFDTKDFITAGRGEANYFQNWVLKLKYQKFSRETGLALTFNDLADAVSTNGSAIWKKTGKGDDTKVELVNLRNIYFDTRAKSLDDCDIIVEMHSLNYSQIKEKEEAWDNVPELLKKCEDKQHKQFDIWEFWGTFEDEYKHVIGYGYGEDEVILFDDTVKREDRGYYDFHIGSYRGVWLRVGVAQRLFKLQERTNQLINQNAATTEIASLLLLRTNDGSTNGNVLRNAETGQIIESPDLQQIVLQNPGINLFVQEYNLIQAQADELCLTPDVVTGEMSPSGTPFRSLAVSANAAKSAFRFIKEGIGEKIVKIMMEDLLPELTKGWKKEDIIELAENDADVEMFDKLMVDRTKIELVIGGTISDPSQLENLAEEVKQFNDQNGRKIKIPKNFFDFKWGLTMNPTGESIDKSQQNDAYFNALQMIQANPAIGNNRLFRQYLENNNISYWKLTKDEMAQLQQGQGSGTGNAQPIGKKDAVSSLVDTA